MCSSVNGRSYKVNFGAFVIFMFTIIPSVIYVVNDFSATNHWASFSYLLGLAGSIFVGIQVFGKTRRRQIFAPLAAACFILSFVVLSQEDTSHYSGYRFTESCAQYKSVEQAPRGSDFLPYSDFYPSNFDIFKVSLGFGSTKIRFVCPGGYKYKVGLGDYHYLSDGSWDQTLVTRTKKPFVLTNTNNLMATCAGKCYMLEDKVFGVDTFSNENYVPTRWSLNLNWMYSFGVLLSFLYLLTARRVKIVSPNEVLDLKESDPSMEPDVPLSNEKASTLDDLERLVKLRDQGVLTEEEFAKEKAKILGGAES